MVALLLCLTLLTETFVTPRHLRFPGQPAKRKMVSSLYQFLSSPEELTIARQRLQALMQGDQAIAASIGSPLYDTLLSIRNGVEQSVEAKRQTSSAWPLDQNPAGGSTEGGKLTLPLFWPQP